MRSNDEDVQMPPKGARLKAAQIADLEAWVKMGATFPQTDVHESQITARARTHWAFQPVTEPAVSAVKQQRWVQTPVDAFVLAALSELDSNRHRKPTGER